MLALQAYYDGNAFIPIERRDFKLRQSAIIVVDEPNKSVSKSSCRGIAAAYANPKLIEKESEYISKVFSGD